MISRRRALFGLLAAPAIVAAPSLMRVSTMPASLPALMSELLYADGGTYQRYSGFDVLYTGPPAFLIDRSPSTWWMTHG